MSFMMFCMLMSAVHGTHTDSSQSNECWSLIWIVLAILAMLSEIAARVLKP